MFRIKDREIPTAIGAYYIAALIHIVILVVIKIAGWNSLTNILFFAVSFITLGIAAYLLHMYFKKENEEMSEEEKKLKGDYGQIWVIVANLAVLIWFLFTW